MDNINENNYIIKFEDEELKTQKANKIYFDVKNQYIVCFGKYDAFVIPLDPHDRRRGKFIPAGNDDDNPKGDHNKKWKFIMDHTRYHHKIHSKFSHIINIQFSSKIIDNSGQVEEEARYQPEEYRLFAACKVKGTNNIIIYNLAMDKRKDQKIDMRQ